MKKVRFMSLVLVVVMVMGLMPVETVFAASTTLEMITGAIYEDLGGYSEDLMWVKENGKYKYVDTSGKVVIDKITTTKNFPNAEEILSGEIEKYGEHTVEGFRGGYALLSYEDGRVGIYIDKTGNTVFGNMYFDPRSFSDGVAIEGSPRVGHVSIINADGSTKEFSAFDSLGNESVGYGEYYREGLTEIVLLGELYGDGDELYGYMDKNFNIVIKPQFENATGFNNGMALAKKNGLWGVINKSGQFIIQPQFESFMFENYSAESFTEGLAAVKKGGKWGYIDTKGNTIVPFQWDSAYAFFNGYAVVVKDGKFGYIDKTGKSIIEPKFDGASYFHNGIALASYSGVYKLIDPNGNAVSSETWNFEGVRISRNYPRIVLYKQNGLWGIAEISAAGSSTPSAAAYIYNTVDPGASVVLDPTLLASVTDQATAVKAIETQAGRLTTEQKQSATGIDLMTLFATEAVANAASQIVSGGSITIGQSNVQALQSNAASAKAAAEKALSSAGIAVERDMDETVKFKTSETGSVTITVDSSAVNTTADNVCIEMPDYSITLSKEMITENTKDSPLIITINENTSMAMLEGEGSVFVAAAKGKSYDVKFNKTIKEDVKVSLPSPNGDNSYMAVFDEGGYVKGGKYNPAIDKVEARINTSGTYTTKENKKDFSDIQSKSAEMQEAIRVLSSKGIINGTSETAFSPDATITRAQIAQLITKTLSKLDANANGGFSDVKSSDWFFGAAGSAKAHGIMSGTSETTFAPNVNIPKDQIVAVSARVLRNEMHYNNPSNASSMLNKYSDGSSIPDWAKTDVALATQLNLVVQRTDGSFSPATTMTRGDAAIILYRMFMKIW